MLIYPVLVFGSEVGVCLVKHIGKVLAVVRNRYGNAKYIKYPVALVYAGVELEAAYLFLLFEVDDSLEVGETESQPTPCAVVGVAFESVYKCHVALEGVVLVNGLQQPYWLCSCLVEGYFLAEEACLATLANAFCLERATVVYLQCAIVLCRSGSGFAAVERVVYR